MIKIYAIDHRQDPQLWQKPGPVIEPWIVQPGDEPGDRYADHTAVYGAWKAYCQAGFQPEHIGFFGYRKYLVPPHIEVTCRPEHNQLWYECSKESFDRHREFWSEYDGGGFLPLLATYDMLVAAPFNLGSEGLIEDFKRSRSVQDGNELARSIIWPVPYNGDTQKIYPTIYITRWSVFDRMMRELDPLRQQLDELVTARDSVNPEYTKRPMAYIMERLFSMWIEQSGLALAELPLLHCWEMNL